jgi:glycosyltransferase involved in cell wall biosynthesis
MRILYVHERFGAFAGAEVNAYLTGAALKARGHTIGILHGASTGKGEAAWRDVFEFSYNLFDGRNGEGIAWALHSFKPDAIYIHKMADLHVLGALLNSGCPVVRMVHDHDLYCMRSYKYNPLSREICTRAASTYCMVPCGAMVVRDRQADLGLRWVSYLEKRKEIRINQRFHKMLVATDYMRQELLRNGFAPDRIEVHAPAPMNSVELESSFSDRNVLIYAGQIIRGKGVDVLLQALKQVQVKFQCFILGDGNQRGRCERLCHELGLDDRVSFEGYVPPAAMSAYYKEASVAVMSSVWPEPFGAAGLEAMHCGLPVVAFDAGGIREWLIDGENGFLARWMDREQFARRVEQLLQNKPMARQMGARGRLLVRDKFNFSNYITGLESLFTRVREESASTVRQ